MRSGDFDAWGLSLSPDGRYVVYDRPSGGATDPRDIYLLATDGSRDEPLVQNPANDAFPLWTPDGRGVIFASDRSGRLGAWLVRVHDGKPDGPPEVVHKDMGPMMPVGITGQGAYYYMLRTGMVDVYQAQLDPVSGKARQAPTPVTRSFAGSNIWPDWSPDGRSLAYVSQRGALYVGPGSRVLVIRDLESGRERELTPNLPFYIHPRWSPDSRSIAVKDTGTDGTSQGMQIHQIDVRTGTMDRIDVNVGTELAWTRDGRSLFFGTPEGSIRLRNLATGQEKDCVPARFVECRRRTRRVDRRHDDGFARASHASRWQPDCVHSRLATSRIVGRREFPVATAKVTRGSWKTRRSRRLKTGM